MTPETFLDQLEPCVRQLMAGKEPRMLPTGVPSLGSILVVHAKRLKDREAKLRKLFAKHGLRNWSFIESFDGDAIDAATQECFFGPWQRRIGGTHCCNRESSVLKPHLAFYAMVTQRVQGVLFMEDDVVFLPSMQTLRAHMTKAAAMLKGCDLVSLAYENWLPSIAYMMSNAGARKMLHYSLRRGGTRISNPMDWQQKNVQRVQYHGFKYCRGPRIFSHYGHKTNFGGKLLPQRSTTTTAEPGIAKSDAKP